MAAGNGPENLLDIRKGQYILKIVDKDQHQHVVFGIFFLHRRREQVVLRVVVDHGFGQNLVLRVTSGVL